MKKAIIGVVLALLLPTMSSADYDPAKIKTDIDLAKKMFQIESWESMNNGTGWMGKSKIQGAVFTVNKIGTLMMAAMRSKEQAEAAMLNCKKLGEIGLKPKTKDEQYNIDYTVFSATQKARVEFKTSLNRVIFTAQTIPLGDGVVFSCNLNPAK